MPPEGQRWTTLDELRATHRAEFRREEPGLLGVGMEPGFAIGQRALLVGEGRAVGLRPAARRRDVEASARAAA